jgi:hypothetical protein
VVSATVSVARLAEVEGRNGMNIEATAGVVPHPNILYPFPVQRVQYDLVSMFSVSWLVYNAGGGMLVPTMLTIT